MTVANSSGVVTGKFTIPAGLPAGSKRVSFIGSGGSRGDGIFVGSGTITDVVRRQVTTQTTTMFRVNIDPLAQTFSIPETTQIGAIDLWFSAVGTTPVIVQIRETSLGLPTQSVVSEVRLAPSDINTTSHTRVNFSAPVQLLANTEYAIVVLCDDSVTELRMAELGKWDSANNSWVTSQPYQVGVLLSSSNASTWTPHQDRDLAFRIHRAVFTQNDRTVALGSVVVTDVTDLMLLAIEDTPSSQTRVVYELSLPGGDMITVSSGQPVRLATPVTGDVTISARMFGATDASPILYPGVQLVVGQVQDSATYVSRAIKGGSNVRLKVIFDGNIPGGSSVVLHYKGGDVDDTWQTIPYLSATQIDDGFMEITHEITGVDEDLIQIRMTLTGTAAARPRIRNLRFMTI
ncbi:MAG TPA: hypothetical protein PK580_00215 [Nitrosomonas halophila]|nr:hypothetical protein [Nitrosomonas halophila]